jgi:hypothetical protein
VSHSRISPSPLALLTRVGRFVAAQGNEGRVDGVQPNVNLLAAQIVCSHRWTRRARGAAFWVGVPVAIAAALWWPRAVVLYMGGDAPEFNRPGSAWPSLMADLLYLYPATFLGLAMLGVFTGVLCFERRATPPTLLSLPAYFLPTYVAGIESTGHVRWAMRCHLMSASLDFTTLMTGEILTCAIALASTVTAGAIAAAAFGHRSRFGIPIPPVVGAILVSVACPWLCLLRLGS